MKRSKKILLSIIIPTHNEEQDIQNCLKSLQSQLFKDFEIIIVDDGSTDKTIEILKTFPDVKIIKGQHKGPGFSRNLGAKEAKGEILIFVDADMTFDKSYLKNLTAPILKSDILGTTHDLELVENTKDLWSKCWGRARVLKKDAKKVKIFRAIKKDKFLALGGFDPKYGYADDQTLWFKYKLKPEVAENTRCYHKNPETLKKVYKQSRWIGASVDHPAITLTPIKFIIPFFLLLTAPAAIPIISVKKCYQFKNPLLLPAMLVFMTIRHFGTIAGISRSVYLNKNFR